jgi:hypothetical protein
MKTQEITLEIGNRPVTMQLTEWADGGSSLIFVADDQQQQKPQRAARVFAPNSTSAVGQVRRFRPVEG